MSRNLNKNKTLPAGMENLGEISFRESKDNKYFSLPKAKKIKLIVAPKNLHEHTWEIFTATVVVRWMKRDLREEKKKPRNLAINKFMSSLKRQPRLLTFSQLDKHTQVSYGMLSAATELFACDLEHIVLGVLCGSCQNNNLFCCWEPCREQDRITNTRKGENHRSWGSLRLRNQNLPNVEQYGASLSSTKDMTNDEPCFSFRKGLCFIYCQGQSAFFKPRWCRTRFSLSLFVSYLWVATTKYHSILISIHSFHSAIMQRVLFNLDYTFLIFIRLSIHSHAASSHLPTLLKRCHLTSWKNKLINEMNQSEKRQNEWVDWNENF